MSEEKTIVRKKCNKQLNIVHIPLIICELDNHGIHLFAQSRFGHKKRYVLIDTGASQSVFDKNCDAFSENLFKKITEENASSGINSNISELYLSTIRHFALGGLTIRNYETVFIPFDHINSMYVSIGRNMISGIIGGDLLLKYRAEISYFERELRLHLNIE